MKFLFPDWNHLSDEAVCVSKVAARFRSHDCIDEYLGNFRSGIDMESFWKDGGKEM